MRWLASLLLFAAVGVALPAIFGCAAPLGSLGPPPVIRTSEDADSVAQVGVSAGASPDSASAGARAGTQTVLGDHVALGVTLHYVGLFDREGQSLHSLLYTGELLIFGDHAGFRLSLGLLGGGGPQGPFAAYGLVGAQVFGHVGRVRIYGGAHTTASMVLSHMDVRANALQGVVGVEVMLFEEPWLRVGLGAELQGGRRRTRGADALGTHDHFVGALGSLTIYLGDDGS